MVKGKVVTADTAQKIVVIALHLDKSFRSKELEKGLKSMEEEVIFFQGFDARSNNIPAEWLRVHLSKFLYGRSLTPGEVACAFGHSAIINSVVGRDLDWVLIVEDNIKFSGVKEVIKFLKSVDSNSSALINFFSDSKYNLVTSRFACGEFILQETKSLPTLAKCYSLNKIAISEIAKAYADFGFAGFQADFPLFYLLHTKFYTCEKTPIVLEETPSLIGDRSGLVLNSELAKVWHGLMFLIWSKDISFIFRLRILKLGVLQKFVRRFVLKATGGNLPSGYN